MLTRGTVALTAATVTAGVLAAGIAGTAAGAATAATPPYGTDSNSVGTITFYNASGTAITSGTTANGPLAAYAVGSVAPRDSDRQAVLVLANPDPSSKPYAWYAKPTGTFTQYPVTSGPGAIGSASASTPVYTASSSDETIDQFESTAKQYTGSGYTDMVQVRIQTASSASQVTTTYDEADLLVDPSTHSWTEVYPTNSGGTATVDLTSLSISAPGAVRYGAKARITGTLEDTAKNSGVSGRSVALIDGSRKVATVTSGSNGSLSASVKLTGAGRFHWVFLGSSTLKASTSATRNVAVDTSVSISNAGTIKHGQRVTFYGSSSPASSGIRIYLQELVGRTWKNVGSGVQKRQKLPNHKTAVGWVVTVKIAKKGTYKFRASKPATSSLRGSVSRTVAEHVK